MSRYANPLTLMLVILIMPCAGVAQTASLGVIGGIQGMFVLPPVTPAFETNSRSYTSRAKPFTFGPTVEVSLPRGLAVEFDALYKRLDYNYRFEGYGSGLWMVWEDHNIISRWDLPLLLKYRLRNIAHRPHFSAGLNTNYIVNTTQVRRTGASTRLPVVLSPPVKLRDPLAELTHRSSEGVVVAGGFEFSIHRIRLAPELRYTRWAHENFGRCFIVCGPNAQRLHSNLDQAEVLVTVGLVNPQ
jgi:hypothetical protein